MINPTPFDAGPPEKPPGNDAAPRQGGARPTNPNAHNDSPEAQIRRHLSALFRPGDVFEVRALNCAERRGSKYKSTVSGYFRYDHLEEAVAALVKLDSSGCAPVIYITLNPVNPALLSRSLNRLKGRVKETTADGDIVRRCWLLVDCDPQHPAGISSTAAELEAARQKADAIKAFLKALGWPDPVEVMSGNGHHLLYRIDLPAVDGELVKRFLQALAARFDEETVKIDRSVHNAARVTKVAGTMAANKGDSTVGVEGLEDRPHRRAQLISVPETIAAVPKELLDNLAAEVEPEAPKPSSSGSQTGTRAAGDRFDRFDHTPEGVSNYLSRHGITVKGQKRDGSSVHLYLDRCPVIPDCVSSGDSDIAVIVSNDGRIGYKNLHNRGEGLIWLDVREALEPGYRAFDAERKASARARGGYGRGASGGSVGTPGGPFSDSWPDPQQVPSALPSVVPFDPDLLPDAFRPWITDIAERVQCPIDFPAVAAMVALSSVVGRRIGIRPKRYDDWLVVPNLWGAAIGRPGIMKTPAIQEPLKPLIKLEIEAQKEFEEAQSAFDAAEMVAQVEQKQAKERIKAALNKKDREAANNIAAEALGPETPKPARRRHMTNDSTVEKLGEILRDNPNGVAVYRDELVGLLQNLDKPGQESARAFFLEAWNGTGRFTFDRIGRGTVDIEAAIVSVIGGIQPGPLGAYLNAASQGGAGDDGLMQRFQLAVWPDISKVWKNIDRWPDTEAKRLAAEVFTRLHGLDPAKVGATVDEPGDIAYLRFAFGAQDRFDSWRGDLERIVRSGEEHPAIESHLAKYRSLIPSLALLIHLADEGVGPVTLQALERAIRWGTYLESHARRIFARVIDADLAAAAALAKKIKKCRLPNPFTLRDVYRKGWADLSDQALVLLAVGVLEELGWIRSEVDRDTGGAPATRYLINPKIAESPPGPTDRTDTTPHEDPSVSSGGAPPPPSPETPHQTEDDREVYEP